MQKWEYCSVDFAMRGITRYAIDGGRFEEVARNKSRTFFDPEMNSAIARPGLEGWELVGACHSFVFKRPITTG